MYHDINMFLQWSSAQPFQYLPTFKWQEMDVKRALPSLEQPVFSPANRDINALKAHIPECVMLTKHGVAHLSNVKVSKTSIWRTNSERADQTIFCLPYAMHVQRLHNVSLDAKARVYLQYIRCKESWDYTGLHLDKSKYYIVSLQMASVLTWKLFPKQRFMSFVLQFHWEFTLFRQTDRQTETLFRDGEETSWKCWVAGYRFNATFRFRSFFGSSFQPLRPVAPNYHQMVHKCLKTKMIYIAIR